MSGILHRPGSGWFSTSRLAAQVGCAHRSVERALRTLAERGVVERGVLWDRARIVTVWRSLGGLR